MLKCRQQKMLMTILMHILHAFTDIISESMLSECCRSIIGCRACIEEWALTSNQCLKRRSEFLVLNIIRVAGLSTVLDVVKELA